MAINTHHKNVITEMKIMTKNFVPNYHSLSKISSWNLKEEIESWWKNKSWTRNAKEENSQFKRKRIIEG